MLHFSIYKFIFDKRYRIKAYNVLGFYRFLSDEDFLSRVYFSRTGKKLDLQHPKLFTEKLQWLKIHNHNPLYTTLVDKYHVKDYVARRIGNQYIIKTLGVWESFDEIDFDGLPEQFVLKCTHDSGTCVVCKDKNKFDQKKVKKQFTKALKRNYFYANREWPYKNVKPRIIAEEYMEDAVSGDFRDYKFFCFDGHVKSLYIVTDRFAEGEITKNDYFDECFRHLPIVAEEPPAKVPPKKPALFEEMKRLAEELSKGFPHVRVDLYEANGRIYFGEYTFFHASGFEVYQPEEWNEVFGSWIKLPFEK